MNEVGNNDEAVKFIEQLTNEQLDSWRERYELIIAQANGNAPDKVNPLTRKRIEHVQMPWMIPAWTRGLAIVNAVIEKRKLPAAGKMVQLKIC